MHICIIIPGFSAGESDWCIPALLDFIHHPPEGFTFSIISLRYPHTQKPYSVYGTPVTPLGFAKRAGFWRFMLYQKAMRAIRRIHKQKPIDILHAFWADEAGFIATRAGGQLNIPALVSVMGGELTHLPQIGYQMGRIGRWMVGYALRHAHTCTGGSALLVEALQQRYVSRISRVSLGVDNDLFRPDSTTKHLKGDFAVLHVASLSPIKNQALLIHAFAKLHQTHPHAHLHIVGDGILKSDLETLSQTLNIGHIVTFHGAVAHHDLPRYYNGADVCVITSYHESQSMVVLEAGACGVLTIGTGVGILPELVGSEFIIQPPTPPEIGDSDGLADILRRLADDSMLRVSESASLRSDVMNNYTLAKSMERWGAIYRS
ncbi:MAG: glycosyltransferase, partial [Anaerolineae bacterium]|nr:glycosyltransferase [Anaerolineae bacterium]